MAKSKAISGAKSKLDFFARPIGLVYKGSPYYATGCGTCLSIVAVIAFLALAGFRIADYILALDQRTFIS